MSFWDQFAPDETIYKPTSDESIYWKMKAPSFADERKVASWLRSEVRTTADLTAYELALTFNGTTFPARGTAVPVVGAPLEDVMAFIDSLPAVAVDEMWEKMQEVAPNWGPTFPRPHRRRKSDPGDGGGDGERPEGSHSSGGE